MFQEFFPILEGAPMGDIWLLLMLGSVVISLLMALIGFLQWKRGYPHLGRFAWSVGLGLLSLMYAIKGDGRGLRRWLVLVMVGGWAVRTARAAWRDRQLPTALPLGGLVLFLRYAGLAVLSLLMSVPMALLATDPLNALTLYEGLGVVVWLGAMIGSFFGALRDGLRDWLVWFAVSLSAVAAPYGAWTLVCPVLLLPLLRSPLPVEESHEA